MVIFSCLVIRMTMDIFNGEVTEMFVVSLLVKLSK